MLKDKRIFFISLIILIIISFFTRIGVFKHMENKKIENQKLIEQFKPSIEIYLKTYYNNIDSVTVDKVERKPLGTELIGYVNDDKDLRIFSFITLINDNGSLIPAIENVQVTQEISNLRKEEFKYTVPYLAYELLECQDKINTKEDK